MTWRQLRVLIQHLPPESATMTGLRNSLSAEELAAQGEHGEPEKGRWSQLEQLTASVLDGVRRLEYVLICVNTDKKDSRPSPPEPVRRPGVVRTRRTTLTDEAAEQLFHLVNGAAA